LTQILNLSPLKLYFFNILNINIIKLHYRIIEGYIYSKCYTSVKLEEKFMIGMNNEVRLNLSPYYLNYN